MNSNIAILVVEFQKTWTQDSFLYKLIKTEYHCRNVLENSIKLLNISREKHINVIQSPFIIDKRNKKAYKKIPLLPKLLGQFEANTWRADYTDGIYKAGDYEVTGRTAFDNTIDSNLLDILQKLKAETIYILGFTTDHCVAETMDSLIGYGFTVVLVADATATFSSKKQLAMEAKYDTISSNDLISKIKCMEDA